MKIGFVGSGSMAAAMARGWSKAKAFDAELAFSDGGSGRAAELAADVGGKAVTSNAELAGASDLVVLAVKPAILAEVAAEIAGAGKPVVSLLGATSLRRLEEALPEVPVVRVMPNVAVEVRQGVLCYALSERVPADLAASVIDALGMLGLTIEVEDSLIDAATAVMACSPAYVALLCETLIDAAQREGMTEEEAEQIVAETLIGTGELLREHKAGEIRQMVASPGGSTEAALAALEEGSFQEVLTSAVDASLEKMRG